MSEEIAHEFARVSGARVDDCAAIAHRYDRADGMFRPGQGESYVCAVTPERVQLLMSGMAWLTDIWTAPDGTLFVTEAWGKIYVLPPGREAKWHSQEVPGSLSGLWGLDTDCLWAWGSKGPETVLYRFEKSTWRPIPSPGEIVAIQGIRPDLLFAVGHRGLIARWDGNQWSRMKSPVDETLNGVCVLSDNEAYAVGPSGVVLEGSSYGWVVRERRDHLLNCVAAFKGTLYVGAPQPDSLLALKPGGNLVTVNPQLNPTQMDARQQLLLATPYCLASSTDGKAWRELRADTLEKLTAHIPPGWRPHP
jgi:hypothetical protein